MTLYGNLLLKDPWWLLALLLLPLVLWVRGRRKVSVLLVPFAAAWHRPSVTGGSRWPVGLAALGFIFLVGGLARPQRVQDKHETRSQGYDIMLAIDLSGSMLSEDYEKDGQAINRLQAITPVIQAFINDRPDDRIGLVVFAGRAYTLAPLTFDHRWLGQQVDRLKTGLIQDGTAIGDGLGVALTRLEQAHRQENTVRKGAFVVLLTDGVNNQGVLAPLQAAEIAKSRGIPVYTIGAGRNGFVHVPNLDPRTGQRVGTRVEFSEIDEGTLREIAFSTGGRFFAARDTGTITSAFAAIDRAQKIQFQSKSYLITTELFPWLAAPGLFLLLLGALLVRTHRAKGGNRSRSSLESPSSALPPPFPTRA
jgi:Ca-activated chloride channel family protein